jgi:2-polyprenyl-6-methoxyphenol hydroxylase-like FAD-dependent oxidoreductase
MMGVLPIGRIAGDPSPKAAVFWSLPSDAHAAWRAAGLGPWKDEASGLWPEAMPFLVQIADPDQTAMARYSHGSLR